MAFLSFPGGSFVSDPESERKRQSQMAGGIQSFVPGIVFLSGYGKNHYEILRWGSGLLAYVLAASGICSDRLWGGSNLQRAEKPGGTGAGSGMHSRTDCGNRENTLYRK